ncbi:MAG: HesA/MoeB/ThiF family protein [Candidatus Helarchaeota archaeon]
MGKQIQKGSANAKVTKKKEIERYSRQILLENWDQEKLFNANVFIAGVGALGTIVSLNLTMMGVGHLILCDFDTIEVSNLARQVLFTDDDIGKSKVLTAKVALERINPAVKVTALHQKIEDVNRKIFDSCDVFVDGLDTFEARRYLNSICVSLNKPLIHGGIYGWMGNVQVIIPFETPCLECHPLIPHDRLQKPCTPPGEERKKSRKIDEKTEKIPTLATVSTIIAGIESQEVIKLLLGDKRLDGYLFYDGLSESFTKVQLIRNENCIICGKYRLEGIEFAVDKNDTIRSIKNRLIMSWGLKEPMRIVIKGKIQEDTVKLKDIKLQEKEAFFVWDKLISTPLKLYAIFEGKKAVLEAEPIITLKKGKSKQLIWSEMQELIVDKGRVMYHKNILRVQAWDAGQDIKFFKTKVISKSQRKIRYKLKSMQ